MKEHFLGSQRYTEEPFHCWCYRLNGSFRVTPAAALRYSAVWYLHGESHKITPCRCLKRQPAEHQRQRAEPIRGSEGGSRQPTSPSSLVSETKSLRPRTVELSGLLNMGHFVSFDMIFPMLADHVRTIKSWYKEHPKKKFVSNRKNILEYVQKLIF